MRIIMQENKAQRWRALAKFNDESEALVYLGGSLTQVKAGYREPWFELFDEELRVTVDEIVIQKWVGMPDCGEWVTQANLPIPHMIDDSL